MLKLKGKDTPIMVIPSDSSRANSPRALCQRYLCAASFTLRREEKTPTLMQNKERHMSFLQSPSLISSKKTNVCLPLHFKGIEDSI